MVKRIERARNKFELLQSKSIFAEICKSRISVRGSEDRIIEFSEEYMHIVKVTLIS